jgi:hypothetical protein
MKERAGLGRRSLRFERSISYSFSTECSSLFLLFMGQTSNRRCIADTLGEKKPTKLASAKIRKMKSEKHINTGWSFRNMDWKFGCQN